MATTRTPTPITRLGTDLVGVAADATGDNWVNTGKEMLVVKNGGGGSINVTLDLRATLDGISVTDPVVAVGAGVTKLIGPFPVGLYNDAGGKMNVSYSGVTSVNISVLTYQDS